MSKVKKISLEREGELYSIVKGEERPVEELVVKNEKIRSIESKLSLLTIPQRDAVNLVRFGCSISEAAKELEISPVSVGSRLRHAATRLRSVEC